MNTRNNLKIGGNVVVHNTFTRRWEMKPYIDIADEFLCQVYIINLFDGGCDDEELEKRNVHNVREHKM